MGSKDLQGKIIKIVSFGITKLRLSGLSYDCLKLRIADMSPSENDLVKTLSQGSPGAFRQPGIGPVQFCWRRDKDSEAFGMGWGNCC
jgi:hypothetical protein